MAGLYIPDIEIGGPRRYECAVVYETRLSVWDDGRMTLEFVGGEDDLSFPVIPVPDHGRLIDADVFYRAFCNDEYQDGVHILNQMPTIIPADEEGSP